MDFHQPREQAGFRKDYSTINQINAIKQVIEKSAECDEPLYLAIIDYEKAFDSVEIAAVMEALRDQGVEEDYIMLPEDCLFGRASGEETQYPQTYSLLA